MSLFEGLMIIVALSLNVLLVAEYEGSNLRILNAKKVMLVILIFFLGQMISFGVGYGVTVLPVFRRALTADLRAVWYIVSAVILFGIGVVMIYRTGRREVLVERLRELRYQRVALEAVLVALLTFFGGVAAGFLRLKLVQSFIIIACATILAVVAGLYLGYYQGNRFRKAGFGVCAAMLMGTGIEILVRVL